MAIVSIVIDNFQLAVIPTASAKVIKNIPADIHGPRLSVNNKQDTGKQRIIDQIVYHAINDLAGLFSLES